MRNPASKILILLVVKRRGYRQDRSKRAFQRQAHIVIQGVCAGNQNAVVCFACGGAQGTQSLRG